MAKLICKRVKTITDKEMLNLNWHITKHRKRHKCSIVNKTNQLKTNLGNAKNFVLQSWQKTKQ